MPETVLLFDLLSLNGRDLRRLPLLERKRLLRGVIPQSPCPVLYVDHVGECGVDLFRAVCEQDMEGVGAKLAAGLYTPDATSWVKIKNPCYSQMVRRWELFEGRRGTAA